jgi:hypothetical protein
MAGMPTSMAPLQQYLMPSADEIALARSAAPASISNAAEIMVLGNQGFETASKGSNGFVCMVQRSWFAPLNDPEFWNPKVRSPICFNAAATQTVVPMFLERTRWVLGGASLAEIVNRSRTSAIANVAPPTGAMCFMMSKNAHLADSVGHWHPHLMFFVPRTEAAAWGANLDGSPIIRAPSDAVPMTIFLVPVSHWSDGSSAMDVH